MQVKTGREMIAQRWKGTQLCASRTERTQGSDGSVVNATFAVTQNIKSI